MPETLINLSTPKRKARHPSAKVLRHAVMAFFFVFLLHVAYDHQVRGGGPRGTPSVEAYCPFGGLETLYQFVITGGFIRRVEPSALVLLVALVLLTLVASRGFCGWICPFGSLQEWLGLLGRRVFKKRFNPTGPLDRALRYLKYVVLAGVIGLTWHTGALVFRDYDPFLAFFHLGKGIDELKWAYLVLGVVLAGSLYIERFFCKYACPLGAALGLLGRIGLTKIHREPADCKGCNLCHTKCHAHVDFLSHTVIQDSECNHCMDCVVDCPRPNVLSVRGAKWRFSHPVYASVLVTGLFAVIGTSSLAGKWQTKPSVLSFAGPAGKVDPENIRGWMTLQEISAGYSVPLERLYQESGLPSRVPATARLNIIAREYKVRFEPDALREVVRRLVSGEKPAAPEPAAAPKTPAQAKEHGPDEEVKGFMTLNEISVKTGVPKEYILKTAGLPLDIDGRTPVREWMHAQGKSIQDIRAAVKEYAVK